MALRNLQDLYVDELKDLYNAEQQILKALPKMSKAASTQDLKSAFDHHLEQTRHQVERLDLIFEELGTSPRGKKCLAMQGLIEEGREMAKEKAEPSVKDAGLISAAQRVEHYEMAGYGSVRSFAELLGYNHQAQALQETLNEEGEADHKLNQIAMDTVNQRAQAADKSGNGKMLDDIELDKEDQM